MITGNLYNLLEGFSRRNPGTGKVLQSYMRGSLAGKVFSLAVNQPVFFKSAPILYPKKLLSLVGEEEADERKLARQAALLESLEDIAKRSPWMFGLSDVMYKMTKFSGLEAPYSAIKSIGWYRDLPDLHKAALYTYDLLKATCRQVGHTYLLDRGIQSHIKYYQNGTDGEEDKYSYSHVTSALEFLIEMEVVKRQVKNAEVRFHLMRYWKAEESICESLESVLTEQEIVLDVDLEDESFQRIRGDPEQMTGYSFQQRL